MSPESPLSLDDVAWLRAGLEHAAPAVRRAALHALVRLPLDRAGRLALADHVRERLARFVEAGADDDAPQVLAAAPYVATPAVAGLISSLADRAPPRLARQAVLALARSGDARAAAGLAAQLRAGEPADRSETAEALARLDRADAQEALHAAGGDDEVEVRFWAALALARRGELEPLRGLLRALAEGLPFPPLFGDPAVFLRRLAFLRSWPRQVRAALASLAETPDLGDDGATLAGLLRDAVSAAAPAAPPTAPDMERLQRASEALDDQVAHVRATQPPAPPTPAAPGQPAGPGARTGGTQRDIIELLEHAADSTDPMAALELGNRIVELADAIGPGYDPDVDAAARVYTGWRGDDTVLPQIAWLMARGGALPALAALGRRVEAEPSGDVYERAARGAEDVARGLHAVDPPFLGGGDVPDVPPRPLDMPPLDDPDAAPPFQPPPTPPRPDHAPARPPAAPAPPPPPATRGAIPPRGPAPPGPSSVLPADTVLLGASAPRAVVPGDELTARFVAYVKALETDVRRVLADLGPRDVPVLGVQSAQWRRGTEVTVRLAARRLEVEPASRTFVWDGTRAIEDFQVFVPDDVRTGVTTTLRFDVSILDVRVATLSLPLEIAAERVAARATAHDAPAAAAFASYSSEDRARVHDCLNALTAATTMDVFMDVAGLRAGDDWHQRVAEEVGRRPVFLLFWSKFAKDSRWVDWEWREAVRQHGVDGIQPVPLDPPALAAPPAELNAAHFNSVHALLRVADQALRPPAAPEPPAG